MEHAKLEFEYAVVRVVPRVEREEFLNVGVVLYCKARKFLGVIIRIPEVRFRMLADFETATEVRQHLQSFEAIAKGENNSGPIAELPEAERFRWLTATRSTVVQCSKVHTGLCELPEAYLEHLCQQLVD